MKKTGIFIILTFLSFCLLACSSSETILTIDVTDGNPSDITTVEVHEGDRLSIWNSIDIEYYGDFDLQYTLELQLNSKPGMKKTVDGKDPSIKMMSKDIKVQNKGQISWQSGRILSGITISEDGILSIRITPEIQGEDLTVKRNAIQIKKS